MIDPEDDDATCWGCGGTGEETLGDGSGDVQDCGRCGGSGWLL